VGVLRGVEDLIVQGNVDFSSIRGGGGGEAGAGAGGDLVEEAVTGVGRGFDFNIVVAS
jgi:hypothetical protein